MDIDTLLDYPFDEHGFCRMCHGSNWQHKYGCMVADELGDEYEGEG